MNISKKAKIKYLLILLFLNFVIQTQSLWSQDTFRDNFSSVSYTRNDGNQNWNGAWFEGNGETTDPAAGRIQINNNQLRFRDLDNVFIGRNVNLSGYESAVLTLNYNRTNGDENLSLWLRDGTSGNFQRIETILTENTGTYTYNLPAAFIGPNSGIAFNSATAGWGVDETIFFDNVQITGYNSAVTANNVTVEETAGNAIFTITHDGPSTGPFSIDYQTIDITAFADSDYTQISGTLNFSGNSGETRTVVVPIIDNIFGENTESFELRLFNISNTTIGVRSGVGNITDDSGDTDPETDVELTVYDRFNGYFDYSTGGGSFRSSDTNTCAINSTSSGTLTSSILPGATIEKAYLIWAHSGANADDVVNFEGQNVAASKVNRATFGSRVFHSMISDVTAIVNTISNPSTNVYDVSGLKIDNTGLHCSANTTLGGWSLFVFYRESSLPAVRINMYNGFDGEQNNAPGNDYELTNFFAVDAFDAKTTILAWEGDQGLADNELLSFTASAGTFTLNGDGDNDGTPNNPFNSTIYNEIEGSNVINTRGIDLDTYDISSFLTTGDTSATTTVQVGGDFVLLNSVLLKVPGNLIVGTVFEDLNYPGGPGRDRASASDVGLENVTVELYRQDGGGNFVLEDTTTTDNTGEYLFAGMDNGTYWIRVVNATVRSSRGGGATCTTCIPVQTFRRNYSGAGTTVDITNEVGGANPQNGDVPAGTVLGAQSVSTVLIDNEGIANMNFGFNFNTIVNTNNSGQGSLSQFIINSNNLNENGLDIEAHPNDTSFNPTAGDDVSIFMIPSNSDPLGRTADANFNNGIFSIQSSTGSDFPQITGDNTKLIGLTQTLYSGDTNTGAEGTAGTQVGVNNFTLPDYNRPELYLTRTRTTSRGVVSFNADNVQISHFAIHGNINSADGIQAEGGSDFLIANNFLGTNALGVRTSNTRHGIRVNTASTTGVIAQNYLSGSRENGVRVNGSTSLLISENYFQANGQDGCDDHITIRSVGNGVVIENNLFESISRYSIQDITATNTEIRNNTIRDSGTGTSCDQNDGIFSDQSGAIIEANVIYDNNGVGIRLNAAENMLIRGNQIYQNGEEGIQILGDTSTQITISQNSIYANGTVTPSLGIDLNDDGVTKNDNGDNDIGPNGLLNFPIIESATINGSILRIAGWARPGSLIEVFFTDIQVGTATSGDNTINGPIGTVSRDYGEGQIYLGNAIEGSAQDLEATASSYTDVDNNTDTTERFNLAITLNRTVRLGDLLTATATLNNSTSEFSPEYEVKRGRLITNRRITYRVSPPITTSGGTSPPPESAAGPTGTPTNDVVIDALVDNSNKSFKIEVRNTTNNAINNYEIFIENVPYSSINEINFIGHTLQTFTNDDGTYNHLFTNSSPLQAFGKITIEGQTPSPLGTGSDCNCVSVYTF